MKIRYKNLLILSILILASCVAAVCLNRLIVGAYCLAAGAVILLFAVFAPELTIRKEWIKELTLLLNACAAFAVIELITGALFGIDPISMLYNVLIIYLFGKVIETIFGSPKIAMISIQVFGLFSGIAEYYVVLFRGTPIVPWDLIVLKTAATVFSAYEFHYPKQIYLMVMVFIGMIAVIQKLHYEADHKKWIVRVRSGCAALIAAGLVVGAVYPNLKTAMWDMIGIYQQQGLVASFVANLQYTFYDEPDGYSEEAVREILDETPLAETISDVKALNVIFVMNEAFSDLRVINSDLVSDEYMPIWDRLTENTLKGFVHVPVFGNGTCDSEFEALTGVSTRYSGGYPFVLRVRYDTESIVRGFERNGFETVGYHPYFGDNWNRRWCYNSFGFDTFYSWDTDWEIEMLRGYASDAFNYKKVIRYNEESSSADHGFFMFNVTMQNHGGFTGDWDNFTKTVDLSEYGGYPEAETYFSLLQISDKEIGELISYYEQVDEPTLICIFGDHQPKIEDAYYEMLFGKKITELSQTEMMRRYVTPVMFWANYDIPEGDLGEFSVNYLSPLLMQYAGYELNPFQSLLLQMKEEYPVLSRNGIIASDGELISAEEEQESQLLKDYQMICYYLLQGGMVQ